MCSRLAVRRGVAAGSVAELAGVRLCVALERGVLGFGIEQRYPRHSFGYTGSVEAMIMLA